VTGWAQKLFRIDYGCVIAIRSWWTCLTSRDRVVGCAVTEGADRTRDGKRGDLRVAVIASGAFVHFGATV